MQDVGLSEVALEKFMGLTVELLEVLAQASCTWYNVFVFDVLLENVV